MDFGELVVQGSIFCPFHWNGKEGDEKFALRGVQLSFLDEDHS